MKVYNDHNRVSKYINNKMILQAYELLMLGFPPLEIKMQLNINDKQWHLINNSPYFELLLYKNPAEIKDKLFLLRLEEIKKKGKLIDMLIYQYQHEYRPEVKARLSKTIDLLAMEYGQTTAYENR